MSGYVLLAVAGLALLLMSIRIFRVWRDRAAPPQDNRHMDEFLARLQK